MAPDYRPKIKKQSQAKTFAEFDSAMDWLEKLPGVSSIGRSQTYRDNLSKVFRLILENRTDQILKQISPPEFIETHFEANALIEVWRQFQTDNSARLAEKLRRVVGGQPYTSAEGKKTEPRDILFELELAALLKEWSLPVDLGDPTDLIFEFQNTAILCECKRVQNPNALDGNLQEAGSQLRKRLANQPQSKVCLGMIGINVSKIVHLDASGTPRYPSTFYGKYLLPPNIVAVQNQHEFWSVVKQRLESFMAQHARALQRQFSTHVAGYLLFYRVPGMNISGIGQMSVNTYPQIGPLRGATRTEDQLLRDLHAHLLQYYL